MSNLISGNAGVAGAVVTLVGFATGTAVQATADGSGNYSFTGLAPDTYYLQPSLAGFTFSPYVNKPVLVSTDITGVNFTAASFTPSGVWTKQGDINLVTPGSANGSSLGGTQPTGPCVLYDINPVVISANPDGHVFKMWYMDGANIRYAESPYGLTWTVRAGNIFTGNSWFTIFKNGSTYYGYASPNGTIHSYTSTDGVNFTLQNASAIAHGGAGTWDAGGNYQLTVCDIIAGTWHALYTGLSNNLAGNTRLIQALGHATSTDGLTWTPDTANNPVIFNGAAADVHKRNGVYYAWMNTCTLYQSTSGGLAFQYTFPNDIYRVQSTDLINWTNEIISLPRTLLGEGANTMDSQTGNQVLVEVSGNTYMFYMGTNSGSGTGFTPTNFLTLLATAPMSIAALALTNEGVSASPQLALDSFNRANENPLSNGGAWTTVPGSGFGGLQLSSNLVEPIAIATWGMMKYAGVTFPNDQYVEVVLKTGTGSTVEIILPLRITSNGTSSINDYQLTIIGGNTLGALQTINWGKVVAGTFTQIKSTTATPLAGDVWRFQVVGTTFTVYQNGVLIAALTGTDSSLASGSPGLQLYNGTAVADTQISGWAAGSATPIALPAPHNDDLTLPYIGCVSLASGDSGGTQFVGHVKVIGSPRAGVPNPYLGNMYVVTAPGGRDDKFLGEVSIVSGPPAGTQGTDSYLGHIAEE